MAGSIQQIHSDGIGVTVGNQKLNGDHPQWGGHGSATFLVDVTAITGTWEFLLSFRVGDLYFTIASVTGITATGLYRIPLSSDFASTRMAIPPPDYHTATEAVAGSVTFRYYAAFSD